LNKIEEKEYIGIALDPIYVGAGGYRLGYVDNTIVRDPVTNIPKIPGTSFAGAVREYSTLLIKEEGNKSKEEVEKEVTKYFGDGNKQSIFRFYDGEIIFFPVASNYGAIWITTKDLIERWFKELEDKNGEKPKIPENIEESNNKIYVVKNSANNNVAKPISLGWLFLEVVEITDGSEITLCSRLKDFVKNIVIVTDNLFSQIVNDNLEVRTSVKIDSTTGTAAEGALFTYEAIPRGTIFGFDVIIDRRREDELDGYKLIKNTFPYFKLLGIGGMGTRGFGRIDLFEAGINDEENGGKVYE
jgi:CRISPR-associated protein Cmr4